MARNPGLEHTHVCSDCGDVYPCGSPMVSDHDGSEPHCEGEWAGVKPECYDCWERRQQVIRDEAKVEGDR